MPHSSCGMPRKFWVSLPLPLLSWKAQTAYTPGERLSNVTVSRSSGTCGASVSSQTSLWARGVPFGKLSARSYRATRRYPLSPFQAMKGNCDLSCFGVLLGLRSLPCTQTQGAKDQGQRTQPQALPASGAMPKGSTAGDQLGSLRGYTVLFHPSFPVLIARAGSPQDIAKARGLHDRAQYRRVNSTAEGEPVHGLFSLPQKAAFVSIITHRQSQANHCKINSACTRSVWRQALGAKGRHSENRRCFARRHNFLKIVS